MDIFDLSNAISIAGHDAECMCVKCLNADLDAHIIATRGHDVLARINTGTQSDKATVQPVKTRNLQAGQRVGNGYVRTISEAQKRLVLRLINERDISNLTLLPGQTIDPNEIGNMGVKGGSALIDKLFNCPEKPKAILTKSEKTLTGSPKQIEWITKGLNGKPSLLADKAILTESDITKLYAECNWSAKNVIDKLLKMPKTIKAETNKEITEGMYKVGERIFKVQTAKTSNRLYAKELVDGSFEYAQGAMRIIKAEHRMTLDEAKAYGKATGTCCVCSRTLTVKASIEAGIGPICASKF